MEGVKNFLDFPRFSKACNPSRTLIVGSAEDTQYYIDFPGVRGSKIIEELERTIAARVYVHRPGEQLQKLNCHVVYTILLALNFFNDYETLKNRLGDGLAPKVLPMVQVSYIHQTYADPTILAQAYVFMAEMTLSRISMEPSKAICRNSDTNSSGCPTVRIGT